MVDLQPQGDGVTFHLGQRAIELLRPWALCALIALPLVFLALRRSLVDLPRKQQWLSATLRALLSGLGDDSEWFHRARKAGVRLVYDESLYVWHRHDHLSVIGLGRKGYRQGHNLVEYVERVGSSRQPRLSRALRYAGHAVAKRCARGVLVSAREFGYLAATRSRRRRRSR